MILNWLAKQYDFFAELERGSESIIVGLVIRCTYFPQYLFKQLWKERLFKPYFRSNYKLLLYFDRLFNFLGKRIRRAISSFWPFQASCFFCHEKRLGMLGQVSFSYGLFPVTALVAPQMGSFLWQLHQG